METVLFLKSDRMGRGDDRLGRKLLKSFLSTILAGERRVDRIICVNSAVFLTTEGSHVVDELKEFEELGTTIFSCGTCLKHFDREDRLIVGSAGDMAGAVAALFESNLVVSP